MDMLNKAAAIFKKYNEYLYAGYTFRLLGKLYDQQKDYSGSRKSYYAAASFLSKAGDSRELERVYYELGRSFYVTFETDSSTFYLVTALKKAEELNDPGKIFTSSGMLGELYLLTDDPEKAVTYFSYALRSRMPTTSKVEVRNRLSSYAGTLMLLGDFVKADSVMQEYESVNAKLGDAWGVINSNKLKGEYYYYRGEYARAQQYLRQAAARTNEIRSFTFDVKNIYICLGKAEYKLGLYDSAIIHLTYAKDLANQSKFGADVMEAALMLSNAFRDMGRTDSAYYHFMAYDHIKDSLFTMMKEKSIIEVSTRYESEKKEQQIRLLKREQDLSAYRLRAQNDEIEKQNLVGAQRTQQLALLSQQNEISRLEASEKSLAFANQQKEMTKKQNELTLLVKEKELQAAVAAKEGQRKNFAYIAIAGVLLFSAYVYYRSARNKKLSRQLAVSLTDLKQAQEQLIKTEKEKEAENIRVRISRDIHDEVGATLSGVALFSEIARERMQQQRQEDAQVYLDYITVNSKEMVDKMSDIVWAINPDNDSFERIVAKLQVYAFNLCAGKGIVLHIHIDDSIQVYYPSMQVKRNLYLFMKEAINNAVKYSEGKNIFLSLQKEGDRITAEIKDDGKGFDSGKGYEGNGLNNMKARAASLEGRLTIDSQKGAGTSVRLQFNFHPAGGQPAAV